MAGDAEQSARDREVAVPVGRVTLPGILGVPAGARDAERIILNGELTGPPGFLTVSNTSRGSPSTGKPG